MIVSFLLVACVTTITVGLTGYWFSARSLENMLGKNLRDVTRGIAAQIPKEEQQQIELAIKSQETKQAASKFSTTIQNSYDLVTQVSIVVRLNLNEFVVARAGDPNKVGNRLTSLSDIKNVYVLGLARHTGLYSTKSGSWLSAFSPIRNKRGDVIAVLKIDYAAQKEIVSLRKTLVRNILFPALAVLLCAILLGTHLGRSIAKPIESLAQAASKVASGDLTQTVPIRSQDEVGKLSETFNTMVSDIRSFRGQLEEHARTLEKKVEERTKEVIERKRKSQDIFDNIQQGILSFGPDLLVENEFSQFLATFYEEEPEDIPGVPFIELVFPNAKLSRSERTLMLQGVLSIIGSDSIAWELNKSHLPTEAVIEIDGEEKVIGLDWAPIVENGTIVRMMLAIKDRTEVLQYELKMAREKAQTEKLTLTIMELVPHPRHLLAEFFNDTGERIERLKTLFTENIDPNKLFIELHTVKGAARSMNFKSLMELAHETEEPILDLRKLKAIDSIEDQHSYISSSRKQFALLQGEFDRYQNIYNEFLSNQSSNTEDKRRPVDLSLLGAIAQQLHILKKEMHDHHSRIETVTCEDSVMDWNKPAYRTLANMLIHALNNTIDHGYIRPSQRLDQPVEPARIAISAQIEGEEAVIRVLDEGAGIDVDAVAKRAKAMGLALSDKSESAISQLLFSDGFSSAETTTKSSGRGVGMSAIQDMAKKQSGSVSIRNRTDGKRGTELVIRFPKNTTQVIPPTVTKKAA